MPSGGRVLASRAVMGAWSEVRFVQAFPNGDSRSKLTLPKTVSCARRGQARASGSSGDGIVKGSASAMPLMLSGTSGLDILMWRRCTSCSARPIRVTKLLSCAVCGPSPLPNSRSRLLSCVVSAASKQTRARLVTSNGDYRVGAVFQTNFRLDYYLCHQQI